MTARRVIAERIVLEAKRLLAHSQLPVASISNQLGFDEANNFVKTSSAKRERRPSSSALTSDQTSRHDSESTHSRPAIACGS